MTLQLQLLVQAVMKNRMSRGYFSDPAYIHCVLKKRDHIFAYKLN